jgi:hypothetical protein
MTEAAVIMIVFFIGIPLWLIATEFKKLNDKNK